MTSTAVLRSTPIVAENGDPICSENEFVRLHKACRRDLEAFYENTRQFLDVLALAELFPKDIEKQAALEYHFKVEIAAKQDYDRRRRDLVDFVVARTLEKKASRKQPLSKQRRAVVVIKSASKRTISSVIPDQD